MGGMSELSYSISDAGTHAHMTASGISTNFNHQNPMVGRVEQCLDDFLGDVIVDHNQQKLQRNREHAINGSQRLEGSTASVGQDYRDSEEPLNDLARGGKDDVNLAQAFLQRKLARQKQLENQGTNSNPAMANHSSGEKGLANASSDGAKRSTSANKQPAGGRTKEELLAIRKAMMKPSGLSKRTNTIESSNAGDSQQSSA